MKEIDDLKDFLSKAHGEITIRVDGMAPHVEGTINDSGMMMAAFACMKCIETRSGGSFDNTVEMFKGLNFIIEPKSVSAGVDIDELSEVLRSNTSFIYQKAVEKLLKEQPNDKI